MSAEDLRLAAWAADAWVVYMPPTLADSAMGISSAGVLSRYISSSGCAPQAMAPERWPFPRS